MKHNILNQYKINQYKINQYKINKYCLALTLLFLAGCVWWWWKKTQTIVEGIDIKFDETDRKVIISGDPCNSNFFLKNDYAEDICTKYTGDYATITEKCKGLSASSCVLTDCCNLINGNKCVAGTATGPVYNEPYNFYNYKTDCYGRCDVNDQFACSRFADNNTHISKGCILKMFNDAGCPNKTPSFLTDDIVNTVSNSSKLYLKGEVQKLVDSIKDSTNIQPFNLCYGN